MEIFNGPDSADQERQIMRHRRTFLTAAPLPALLVFAVGLRIYHHPALEVTSRSLFHSWEATYIARGLLYLLVATVTNHVVEVFQRRKAVETIFGSVTRFIVVAAFGRALYGVCKGIWFTGKKLHAALFFLEMMKGAALIGTLLAGGAIYWIYQTWVRLSVYRKDPLDSLSWTSNKQWKRSRDEYINAGGRPEDLEWLKTLFIDHKIPGSSTFRGFEVPDLDGMLKAILGGALTAESFLKSFYSSEPKESTFIRKTMDSVMSYLVASRQITSEAPPQLRSLRGKIALASVLIALISSLMVQICKMSIGDAVAESGITALLVFVVLLAAFPPDEASARQDGVLTPSALVSETLFFILWFYLLDQWALISSPR
jgi:hypothetical protein